jgi:hypothetical protein
MWAHLRQRYQPSGDALYLSVVRREHALQEGDSTIDQLYTQSAAGVILTLFALLFAAPSHAARQCALTWSFSASMSSHLGSTRSSSPDVLSCWCVDVFLSLRYYLSFVLRRPAYLVLGCLRFLLCLLLVVLLCRLL